MIKKLTTFNNKLGNNNGLAVWQDSNTLENGSYLLYIKENNQDKENKSKEKKLFTLCGLFSSTIVYVW